MCFRGIAVIGVVASLLAVSGCTSAPSAAVTSVTIDQTALTLDVGESAALTTTVVVTGGASQDVEWSISPPNIATVDAVTGVVTAVAPGAAEIRATSAVDASKTGTAALTVNAVPSAVTSTVAAWPRTLSPNGSNTSTVTIQLKDADGNDLTSGGHDVAIVAPGTGSIGVVVDHGDGSYSATYTAGTTEDVVTLRPQLDGEPFSVGAEITLAFFLLAENGVTVLCPDAAPDASDTVNGVVYTKRTKQQIQDNYATTPGYAATACTSGITDMNGLFGVTTDFNEDIGSWDTSAVTGMNAMFMYNAFNQDIGAWATGSVTTMGDMFRYATSFDQDIGAWDTSSVTQTAGMFEHAFAFDQDIGAWDTSSVTDMSSMFRDARSFNQDLSGWCVLPEPRHVDFDLDAIAWVVPNGRPAWGTCPSP